MTLSDNAELVAVRRRPTQALNDRSSLGECRNALDLTRPGWPWRDKPQQWACYRRW